MSQRNINRRFFKPPRLTTSSGLRLRGTLLLIALVLLITNGGAG